MALALAIGGVLLATGCSTTGANVTEVQTEPWETRVLVGDKDLYDQMNIDVAEIIARRNNDTGFLEAQATIYNLTRGTIRFEYTWEWYDQDRFKILDVKEHWTPAQIYGNQKLPIHATSPDPLAKSFKIAVRRPQEIK